MKRENPWSSPPKTKQWHRLVALAIPLLGAPACDDDSTTVGTSESTTGDTGFTGTVTVPDDSADTGTP